MTADCRSPVSPRPRASRLSFQVGELQQLLQKVGILLPRQCGHFAGAASPAAAVVAGRAVVDIQVLPALQMGLEREIFLQHVQGRRALCSAGQWCRESKEAQQDFPSGHHGAEWCDGHGWRHHTYFSGSVQVWAAVGESHDSPWSPTV